MSTQKESVATKVWCRRQTTRRGMHRLRVRIADVQSRWSKLDETGQKIKAGTIEAHCPDPRCPEHQRQNFVGFDKIPNFKRFVDD